MVIHPDEAHDGHAGMAQGFAYRMLYVDPASVSAALDGASPPFVPDVVADDAVLADLLPEAFTDFPQALEPLAAPAAGERPARPLAPRAAHPTRPQRRGADANRHPRQMPAGGDPMKGPTPDRWQPQPVKPWRGKQRGRSRD